HRAAVIAKRDRYERGVRALIVEGVRRGKLRAADATVATRAFLGALNWTAQWYRPGGQLDSRAIADRVADYAVGGLLRNTEREGSAERRRSPKGSRSA
ncbi:MAG TPA: TetR/AcrR family transcriptional regulator C-terminal domain-containing protein, partial [Vicinamibacterales bacterium]|nr:TetR/AcrR family transcriptional regulator C-terminal domain-containing protein [Vicinamibacterales bacterium]